MGTNVMVMLQQIMLEQTNKATQLVSWYIGENCFLEEEGKEEIGRPVVLVTPDHLYVSVSNCASSCCSSCSSRCSSYSSCSSDSSGFRCWRVRGSWLCSRSECYNLDRRKRSCCYPARPTE